jgi:trans-2,3-dihydro-3-hydroxyanthranilate isomerase
MTERSFEFVTVDVFTDRRFGGNPLAVFPDARGIADGEMQAIAAEMNLSETTFVLPPEDPAHSARVRIFNRSAEMPFAGHPNVGTGFVLAGRMATPGDVLRFEETAGLVEVRLQRGDDGRLCGAEIDAPQPLRLLGELDAAGVAACVSLDPGHVKTGTHPPVRATVGVEFVLAEVAADALSQALPDLAAFQRLAAATAGIGIRLSILIYARDGERVRSRMFAPLSGTWEDPATGSANATLGALLLALSPARELRLEIRQGEEMGRPSRLRVAARASDEGVRASVGGGCVPVLAGTIAL